MRIGLRLHFGTQLTLKLDVVLIILSGSLSEDMIYPILPCKQEDAHAH